MTSPTHPSLIRANRLWETVSFVAGVLVLTAYGLTEAVIFALCHLRKCEAYEHGTPWGLIIVGFMLVLPKTIGRARAAAVLQAGVEAIAVRIRGRGAKATMTTRTSDGEEHDVATVETPKAGGAAKMTVPVPGGPPRGGKPVADGGEGEE